MKNLACEIKYRSQTTQMRDVPGLIDLCHQKPSIHHSYIITKTSQDLGPLQENVMKIPAALFCYWLGEAEFLQKNLLI